jgi:putative transcriptional regulator
VPHGVSRLSSGLRKACLTSRQTIPIILVESRLYMTSIRNRVKELRGERGWTQQQLAEAVGVSRQSINSIERERYVPSLELALTFARVFGRTTDEIFSLERKK